jgi:hypothetical protein
LKKLIIILLFLASEFGANREVKEMEGGQNIGFKTERGPRDVAQVVEILSSNSSITHKIIKTQKILGW